MPKVVVIDYGVGNLFSVQRGLEQCGAEVTVTADHAAILSAERVLLPGVGAFSNAMQALQALGLTDVLKEVAQKQTPLLGICLGMQLLLDESEEFGVTPGLGLIPGRVVPVPGLTFGGDTQKVPHIGWNALLPSAYVDWNGTLLSDTKPGSAVYFVHSFMAQTADRAHRLADCDYGGHAVAAVIAAGNVAGCQFHPEKSGDVGLRILKQFCASPTLA